MGTPWRRKPPSNLSSPLTYHHRRWKALSKAEKYQFEQRILFQERNASAAAPTAASVPSFGYPPASNIYLPADCTTAWSKCPPGSAPARLLCLLRARLAALAGSALPRERPAHWAPSHCLGCSSWPPPKPPISPPLTIQAKRARALWPGCSPARTRSSHASRLCQATIAA